MPAARAAGASIVVVLAAEATAVAGVWVECAEREAWLARSRTSAEALAGEVGGAHAGDAGVTSAGTSRSATCVVASTTRSRSDASIIATSAPVSAASISVWPGIVVAAREQRGLVDRRGDDAVHLAADGERNGALDGPPRQPSGLRAMRGTRPGAHRQVHPRFRSDGPDHHGSQVPATRGSASARATISGPMPRGSPNVTPRRGRGDGMGTRRRGPRLRSAERPPCGLGGRRLGGRRLGGRRLVPAAPSMLIETNVSCFSASSSRRYERSFCSCWRIWSRRSGSV